MSAVTPSASTFARVGRGALAARRGARALRSPRRVAVRASSSAENANDTPGEEEEDDLPPPIKLTADQARIAALAFEVLYEKDPVEEMEEMLVDRERPGLRLKLQQAIKGAARAFPVVRQSSLSFPSHATRKATRRPRLPPPARADADPSRPFCSSPIPQPRTRRAKTARRWSAPPPGRRSTGSRTPPCERE
jgi:hypothetical protein